MHVETPDYPGDRHVKEILMACEDAQSEIHRWFAKIMDYDLPPLTFVPVSREMAHELFSDMLQGPSLCFKVNFPRSQQELADLLAVLLRNLYWDNVGNALSGASLPGEIRRLLTRQVSGMPRGPPDFAHRYPSNTVFIFSSLTDKLLSYCFKLHQIERMVCHEAFHVLQYEQGLAKKYPVASESTATFIERCYSAHKLPTLGAHGGPRYSEKRQNSHLEYDRLSLRYNAATLRRAISSYGLRIVETVVQEYLDSDTSAYCPDSAKLLLEDTVYKEIDGRLCRKLFRLALV